MHWLFEEIKKLSNLEITFQIYLENWKLCMVINRMVIVACKQFTCMDDNVSFVFSTMI